MGRNGCMGILVRVLVVLVVLAVAMVVAFIVLSPVPNRHYPDRQEILKAKDGSGKKALVVYQPSLSKATEEVAHSLAQGLNDSGYEVTLNVPGEHLSADISPYAIVALGSPVYGGKIVPALAEYMQRITDYSQARVILFLTAGSSQSGSDVEEIKALLRGAEPYAIIKLQFMQKGKNKADAYQLGVAAAGEP
jgi:flavorubredoxin